MRLLTKTTLNLLSISVFIFLFGVVAFYYSLRVQVDRNINQEMEKRKLSIAREMEAAHSSDKNPVSRNEIILIKPVEKADSRDTYSDTLIFNSDEQKYQLFRKLKFSEKVSDRYYSVQIFKSLEETDTLIVSIVLIMTLVVILLIATLLIVNRYSSRYVWSDFYNTVDKINRYDLNSHETFSLESSDVKEFADLNRVLQTMTERIKNDYRNLKEYTENASHEIQTPLAIINSKLELLLQAGEMNEKQYKALADAYEAAIRLSRYNNTLILLAKIENKQFPESKPVFPEMIVNHQLEILEDLIADKQIQVHREIKNDVQILMNPYLAEMLTVNLIKNAVRHNITGGKLLIKLDQEALEIGNSGLSTELDSKLLFQRFYKSSSSPESIGLGLSIVQKICALYGFEISYEFRDQLHCMKVTFRTRLESV